MGPNDNPKHPSTDQDGNPDSASYAQIREEEWGLAEPDMLAGLAQGHRVATPVAPARHKSETMEVTSADFVHDDVVVLTGGIPPEELPPKPAPSLAEKLGAIAAFSEEQQTNRPTAVAAPLVWDDEETRLRNPEGAGRLGQVVGPEHSVPAPPPPMDPRYDYEGPMSLAAGASLDAVLSGHSTSGTPARVPSEDKRSKWNISSDDEYIVTSAEPIPPYEASAEEALFASSGPPSLADGVAAIAARLEERTAEHQLGRGFGQSSSQLARAYGSSHSHRAVHRGADSPSQNHHPAHGSEAISASSYPTRNADPIDPPSNHYPTHAAPSQPAPPVYAQPLPPRESQPQLGAAIPPFGSSSNTVVHHSHPPPPLPDPVGPIEPELDLNTTEMEPYRAADQAFEERPTSLMPEVEVEAYARPADAIEHRRTTLIPAAKEEAPLPADLYAGEAIPAPDLRKGADPMATQPLNSSDLVVVEPEVMPHSMQLAQQPHADPRYGRRIMVIEEPGPQFHQQPVVAELDPFQASPTIPFMNAAPEPARPLARVEHTPPSRPPAAELDGVRNLPLNRGKIDGRLLVLHDPEGEIASKYRLLDFKLRRIAEQRPLRTLALTAPQAQSGTTLTAVNLALIRAESPSARVCVVDLNFRDPSLHRLIGLEPSFTLSDYLAEEATLDQVLVKLEGAPCYLIPAGPARMPPSRLYKHPRLTELFAVLYDTFDLVIMDMPPVLPKADINQVDPLIDAIVMVVSAGKTKGPALRKAKKTIDEQKLVGVVLNEA